jgi:hypothetical protein
MHIHTIYTLSYIYLSYYQVIIHGIPVYISDKIWDDLLWEI